MPLFGLGSAFFFATDKLSESRTALHKALKLYPPLDEFFKKYIDEVFPKDSEPTLSTVHYFIAAESIFQSKNWEKAAELFEIGFQIALTQSQSITLHNYANAGLANFNMENWAKASEYLNKALELVLNTPHQISIEYVKKIETHAGVADLNLIIEAIAKM
jgi:tetratricopeptide (TPR) repeat protein